MDIGSNAALAAADQCDPGLQSVDSQIKPTFAAPITDGQHLELIVEFRSVRNLVLPSLVPSSETQPSNAKAVKSNDNSGKPSSKSVAAAINPQIVFDVDSFDTTLPPSRSAPYPVLGEVMNINFVVSFSIMADEVQFKRVRGSYLT